MFHAIQKVYSNPKDTEELQLKIFIYETVLNYDVMGMRFPNNFILHAGDNRIDQQIILKNNGMKTWPSNTYLKLKRAESDLNIVQQINIGREIQVG